ncbi:type IV secretory system conjugative DNA transfer family protein [Roseomonas sp. NAR14]|uniref:Type IV secretory system conjugative DNA transfer family protein n=1 Tax=Roseomonas acroporae TaxID=2937791 RepID=A0A9X1Y9D4_9PROT|nr:type IV secretory system conjugative DNA transfer family protein [Roseomonas acroporae]MCK8786559.1 type IV secretory system conjugative DNA transfer family protein [Roseomonas acroporae]
MPLLARAPRLPSRRTLLLLGAAAAGMGVAWTFAASAVFLWGSGLLRFFPFEGHSWPWQWWSYALWAPPNAVVSRWLKIGAAVPTGLLALAGWRLAGLRRTRIRPGGVVRGTSDNHGHADWMTMAVARKLFPGPHPDYGGVVVGEAYRVDQDRVAKVAFDPVDRRTWGTGGRAPLLIDPCRTGPTHSLVFAGSGGFKTTTAVSTLLHWTGSAVVLDPSRELGPMLRAAREDMDHRVVTLDPGDPEGGGINVLDWIDIRDPLAETNVQAVVGWIFGEAEAGGGDEDRFFRKWGKQLVACLLAHMLWDPDLPAAEKTLRTLRAGVATPEDRMREVLAGIHGSSRSPMARDLAGSLMRIVDETFSGIYANANEGTFWLSVGAYADLVSGGVGEMPACRTADLAKGKLTVFVQVPLKALKETPAVARVLVGALLNGLYEADRAVEERVLFLLDEVAQLGRMRILETARDAGRKYGITLQLLYQSEGQVAEQWGQHGRNAWFDGVAWRLYAAVQNTDTARALSAACGEHAVMAESEGDNRGSQGKVFEVGSLSRGRSTNRHELKRALIKPDELLQDTRADEAFVLARGAKPLRCGRAIYFRRPEMAALVGANRFRGEPREAAE